jgi:hypothetical protein
MMIIYLGLALGTFSLGYAVGRQVTMTKNYWHQDWRKKQGLK